MARWPPAGPNRPKVLAINFPASRRIPTEPPATHNTLIREATLAGIYVATLAWLQLGRVLTMPLGLLIAFGLALIEFLIRLREKSRWEP